jgi:hypothetical protein
VREGWVFVMLTWQCCVDEAEGGVGCGGG